MSAALTTNVDQRLLRTTKFPPEFNVKVDMRKVHTDLIKAWVDSEISKILKSEDDVVSDLVKNILDESRFPNIKELQIALTGFLDKDAAAFCQNLWRLCVSAQDSPQGVPRELIEAKKADLVQEKAEREKARDEAIKLQETERERERELARIRDRERSERGRGRGGRNGRDFDRRAPRDSRSPPRRRRDDDDFRRSRRADTYIPSSTDDRAPRRRRSPSYGRYSSRSRSPPPRRRRRDESRSRSTPRKRRNTSSDELDKPKDRRSGGENRRGAYSPAPKRRSPSPRRYRRRSPSPSDRSRSPPPKRSRRASPSMRRPSTSDAHSSSESTGRKKATALAPNDLMAADRRKDRPDTLRLSRETASPSLSRSETASTKGGVEERRKANLLRESQLKAQLLAREVLSRADSVMRR